MIRLDALEAGYVLQLGGIIQKNLSFVNKYVMIQIHVCIWFSYSLRIHGLIVNL